MPVGDAWLRLSWDADEGPLSLTRISRDGAKRLELPNPSWSPLWRTFLAARQVTRRYAFSTFAASRAEAVELGQAKLRQACGAIYTALRPIVDELEGLEPTFRTPALTEMPLAAIVGTQRCDRLPLDVHPDLAGGFDQVRAWEFPRIGELTVLVPKDLGELRSISRVEQLADGSALAHLLRWHLDLDRALSAVEAAGGSVVRPLRVEDIVRSLDGEHGRHVVIVAHLDEAEHLHCDDGLLSLPTLRDRVRAHRATGWTTPLLSVDLSICRSAYRAANLFLAAGVQQISCIDEDLQIGEMTALLRRMFESGLVDGTRPMAHAWLLAGANAC